MANDFSLIRSVPAERVGGEIMPQRPFDISATQPVTLNEAGETAFASLEKDGVDEETRADLAKTVSDFDAISAGEIGNTPPLADRLVGRMKHTASDVINGAGEMFKSAPLVGKKNPWVDSFLSGTARLNASIARSPAFLFDLAMLPGNALSKVTGTKQVTAKSLFPDNPFDHIAKYYDKSAESYDYIGKRFKGETMASLMVKGDKGAIAEYLGHQVVANAPQSLAYIGLALSGLSAAGAAGMFITSGAERNKQNQDAGKDVVAGTLNAAETGAWEAIFEQSGTGAFLKNWSEALAKKFGKEGLREILKSAAKTYAAAALQEGKEEVYTQFAEDFTDYITGINPDAMKGSVGRAAEAGTIGTLSGLAMTAPATIVGAKQSYDARTYEVKREAAVSKIIQEYDGDIERAYREGGVLTALTLIAEQPDLAKTALGRGILAHSNNLAKLFTGSDEDFINHRSLDKMDPGDFQESVYKMAGALWRQSKAVPKFKVNDPEDQNILEGGGARYKLNPDVNPDSRVTVVDLTGRSPVGVSDLKASLTSLAGKGIETDAKRWVLSVIPENINHVVYSSVKEKGGRLKDRSVAVNNISDLLQSAVLIESIPNDRASKKDVIAYHRFYVPIVVGEKHYTVRIVAEQTTGDIGIESADLYDVIMEKGRDRHHRQNVSDGVVPRRDLTTSIRDMLSGVKDRAGSLYVQPRADTTKVGEALVRDYLPELADSIKRVSVLFTDAGQAALGMYLSGQGITIRSGADTTVYAHEIAHAFFDLFTTAEEKQAILDEIKRTWGVETDLDAEEILADGFNAYRLAKAQGKDAASFRGKTLSGKISAFFEKIRLAIQKLIDRLSGEGSAQDFYDAVLAVRRIVSNASGGQSPRYARDIDRENMSYEAEDSARDVRRGMGSGKSAASKRVLSALGRQASGRGVSKLEGVQTTEEEQFYRGMYDIEKRLPGALKRLASAKTKETFIKTLNEIVAMQDQEKHIVFDERQVEQIQAIMRDKAEMVQDQTVAGQVKELVRQLKESVIKTADVKRMVKKTTGQVKVQDKIGEEEALRAVLEAKDEAGRMIRDLVNTFVDREMTQEVKLHQDHERVIRDILKRRGQAVNEARKEGKREGIELTKIQFAALQDELAAKEYERRAIVDMIKDIERARDAKMPVEYRDQIEAIVGRLDLHFRANKTLATRGAMKDFVERMKEQGEQINIPQEQLDMLEKTPLNEMTVEDLADVHEIVMRLAHLGKLKNKLIASREQKNMDEVVSTAVDIMTRGGGLQDIESFEQYIKNNNKDLAGASSEKVWGYLWQNLRPEVIFNILDRFESTRPLGNAIWDAIFDAHSKELVGLANASDRLQEIFKEIDIASATSKKEKVGRFDDMTRDTMLYIYANSMNEHQREILYNSGLTDEDIDTISAALTQIERQAVEDLWDYYDLEQYRRLDEVYSAIEGEHMGQESFYFPIQRLDDDKLFNEELAQDILKRGAASKAHVKRGHTKERTQHGKGFSEFSFFRSIMRNMEQVEHYIAYAPAIRDTNKLLHNKDIRAAILQNFSAGDSLYRVLDKWLKDTSYGRIDPARGLADQMAQKILSNYGVSVLGLNLSTVLTQPASIFSATEMVGGGNLGAGALRIIPAASKLASNHQKWEAFIAERSPIMAYRAFHQQRELREMIHSGGMLEGFGQSSVGQKVKKWSMAPIVYTDKAIADCIWLGEYDYQIASGKSEEDAIQSADTVIRRTQSMGDVVFLPDSFRTAGVQKLYTLFRNQNNQDFNLIFESFYKKGEGKISAGQLFWKMVAYSVLPSLWLAVKELRRPPKPEELAETMVGQLVGGLPVLGQMVEAIQDQNWRSAVPVLGRLLADAQAATSGKSALKKLDAAMRIISVAVGIPYTGLVQRPLNAIVEGRAIELLGKPRPSKGPKTRSMQRESERRKRARERRVEGLIRGLNDMTGVPIPHIREFLTGKRGRSIFSA